MTGPAITVREVLRLLLEADSYPRFGNEDWPVAARMEAEALAKAAGADRRPTTHVEAEAAASRGERGSALAQPPA